MVWYSHLFKNFPLFVVIHIVKSFSIVTGNSKDFRTLWQELGLMAKYIIFLVLSPILALLFSC